MSYACFRTEQPHLQGEPLAAQAHSTKPVKDTFNKHQSLRFASGWCLGVADATLSEHDLKGC